MWRLRWDTPEPDFVGQVLRIPMHRAPMVSQPQMDPARCFLRPCHSRHAILMTNTEPRIQRSRRRPLLDYMARSWLSWDSSPTHLAFLLQQTCYVLQLIFVLFSLDILVSWPLPRLSLLIIFFM